MMTLTEADKAYIQIKERIITLEMAPGSVIRETELMEVLGLGRTPIREALMQLEAEKLVVVAPRRGMFVTDVTLTDLHQLYEIRIELEALCANLAAERASLDQIQALEDWAARYRRSNKGDKKCLLMLDRDFHHLLAEATGNKFLQNEFEMFYNLSMRIWYLALDRVLPEDLDVPAHLEILAAVKEKDGEKARQLMRRHIQDFHQTLKQYL